MKKRPILFTIILSTITVCITMMSLVSANDGKLTFANVTAHGFSSGPNFGMVLENTYDGDTSTMANYAASKEGDAYRENTYFQFDLDKEYDISKVEIVFPNIPAENPRVNQFELHISVDGDTYTKVYEFTEKEYEDEGYFEIVQDIKAKHFRLVATSAYEGDTFKVDYRVSEFAVYGREVKDVNPPTNDVLNILPYVVISMLSLVSLKRKKEIKQ